MTETASEELLARIRTLANPGVHWQVGLDVASREMMELARRPGFREAMDRLHTSDPGAYADAVALIWAKIGRGAELPPPDAFWAAVERETRD